MHWSLTEREVEVRSQTRALVDRLIPFEEAVEAANGDVDPSLELEIRRICLASGLFAPNFSRELGGAGLTFPEQVLLEEQLGRLTNCLWGALWRPANVLVFATPAQRERYLMPYIRGEARGCYAITEPDAGSDVSTLATIATPTDDGFLITGEKRFATGGDVAAYFLVVATVPAADGPAPTIFFVPRDAPGLTIGHAPKMTHNTLYGHPELSLRDVKVSKADVLGAVGDGIRLTHDWFREERVMIAARCLGAAARCLELAQDYAAQRVQFGRPIAEYQGVQWLLADSATELAAAQALVYQITAAIDAGLDPKIAHGRASLAKLYASEMVGRVTDRCLQVFGGRGYIRENPVERLWRDTRVDRIWEGTSEIQRVIIARALQKRGLESLIDA
jgi:alkylation response protein AidB-like acyl-CoA dehydrogenase